MYRAKRASVAILLAGMGILAPPVVAQEKAQSEGESEQSEREAMYYRYLEFPSYVKGGSIEPHWMADGSSFWYVEGAPENTIIYKVHPVANTKTPLFDTARLRQALVTFLGRELPYGWLPFDTFTFVDDDEKAARFTVEKREFVLQLDSYAIDHAPVKSEDEKKRLAPRAGEAPSPDGRWFVSIKDHNIWLRSSYDDSSVPVTTDGIKDYEWSVAGSGDRSWWSLDSLKLAVKKVDSSKVPKIPIVHWLKPTEEVEWWPYPRAGEPKPQTELFILDILSQRKTQVDVGEEPDRRIYILGWRPDNSELLFIRANRMTTKFELIAANPTSGSTRVVLTETQTWIDLWRQWKSLFTLLEDGKRFIWRSERDGWNHLYLYDLDGTLIRRLTAGNFPVERMVAVDEKAGYVFFTAHGNQQWPFDRARGKPYDTHLYRVSLDGNNSTRLTEATGEHAIQFAPSKEFFVDTHSTVDRPPVVELRRADGTLLQTLSKSNIDALNELKWSPPEEFVVKAADGKTDLHGVLYKPYDFDPNKKYPVIEHIWAGPVFTVAPRTFTSNWFGVQGQALAQLGFVTFIVDGRGTPGRGKSFRDVVYGNIGRYEIPDHVATLNQLAEKRPYMDLNRMGIMGNSYGGYMVLRAMLQAPDVYHVGIAGAPITDMSEHSGNEIFLGPVEKNQEAYEYASNYRLAGNLKGKLLLIHGSSDRLVPFSHSMKMIEAFIRANKPYDLIVLPGQGHVFTGTGEKYWREAVRRYFQEHLQP